MNQRAGLRFDVLRGPASDTADKPAGKRSSEMREADHRCLSPNQGEKTQGQWHLRGLASEMREADHRCLSPNQCAGPRHDGAGRPVTSRDVCGPPGDVP